MHLYPTLYELLCQYIYGSMELTEHMELTLTILSTIGSLFVVAIPFLAVWLIIKAVFRP